MCVCACVCVCVCLCVCVECVLVGGLCSSVFNMDFWMCPSVSRISVKQVVFSAGRDSWVTAVRTTQKCGYVFMGHCKRMQCFTSDGLQMH